MKVVAILFVLVALGVFALVKFGGLSDFDPAANVEEFKTVVKPGVDWKTVVDRFPPKKMGHSDPANLIGKTPVYDFDKAAVAAKLAQNGYPGGFYFDYVLTAEEHWEVWFDPRGAVASAERQLSAGDLMQGKNWKGPLDAGGDRK